MPQFSVYKNKNRHSREQYPYLLDIQTTLLEKLETRMVVPLVQRQELHGKPLTVVMPEVEIEGRSFVMLTPQMAGVARKELGAEVASLAHRRDEIIAAIDFLFTGI